VSYDLSKFHCIHRVSILSECLDCTTHNVCIESDANAAAEQQVMSLKYDDDGVHPDEEDDDDEYTVCHHDNSIFDCELCDQEIEEHERRSNPQKE
jgi:hypothetical protein